MSGSLKIATVKGIAVRVHWSFLLILAYGAWIYGQAAATDAPGDTLALVGGGLYGILVMLLLFFFVVLHELGHSLAALHYKIPVRDITLLPFGGVARIDRLPEDPSKELVIAIAGPAVNFVLVALLAPLVAIVVAAQLVAGEPFQIDLNQISFNSFLLYLVAANLTLGLFNLVPAFPMDGGRILRALLGLVTDFQSATRVAVRIGRVIAIALGLFGFLRGDFFLMLIALFVYVGGDQEGNEVLVRRALREVCAGDAYNKRALVLGPAQRVSEVVDIMLTSYQPDFAVMVGRKLAGVVTRERVVAALKQGLSEAPVSQIMERDVLRVPPDISLYEVRRRMAEEGTSVAAVFDGDRYLGLLSLADISEAFLLLAATPPERNAQAPAAAA